MRNEWLVFDIDGVLTDGRIWIDEKGSSMKCLNLKDLDSVNELIAMGFSVVAMTAERNAFTAFLKSKIRWHIFLDGVKDKHAALAGLCAADHIPRENVIFIGDGKKDLPVFGKGWRTVCPLDAIADVRELADVVLPAPAGTGILWELVRLLRSERSPFSGVPAGPNGSEAQTADAAREKRELYREVFEEINQRWAVLASGTPENFGCMTLAWASLGALWVKPIVTLYVKPIRNTHGYLMKNEYFTLSFFSDSYKEDLLKIGTVSGREDPHKVEKTALTPISVNDTVAFPQAEKVLVCRRLYHQSMDADRVPADIRKKYYTVEEPHTMIIGEIESVVYF